MTLFCHRLPWQTLSTAIGILVGGVIGAAAGSAGAADRTHDGAVAAFYSGRGMTMISGFTPEGGDRQQERAFAGMTITSDLKARGQDDLHGRLLARHMGRHIPGTPQFTVRTLPGAGGRRAARYLYRQAATDGTVIGNLEQGIATEPLLFADGGSDAFDPTRLHWLGSLRGETGFVIAWTATAEAMTGDRLAHPLLLGGTSPQDDSVLLARALNALIGTRLRVISGYSGMIELQIAMERGEIAGFIAGNGDIKNRLIPWMQAGQARALLQLGWRRDDDLPDAPLALDLARSDEDRAALRLIFTRQALGSPYAAPPGVPAARLAVLRHAFDATMRDGDFRADARRLDIAVQPISGESLQKTMAELAAAPPAVRARISSIIGMAAPLERPAADAR